MSGLGCADCRHAESYHHFACHAGIGGGEVCSCNKYVRPSAIAPDEQLIGYVMSCLDADTDLDVWGDGPFIQRVLTHSIPIIRDYLKAAK